MASTSSYFIDGPSLASSTAVYLDSSLTTCAPDGFYSDGLIVREQVNCLLGNPLTCPECPTPEECLAYDIALINPEFAATVLYTRCDGEMFTLNLNSSMPSYSVCMNDPSDYTVISGSVNVDLIGPCVL